MTYEKNVKIGTRFISNPGFLSMIYISEIISDTYEKVIWRERPNGISPGRIFFLEKELTNYTVLIGQEKPEE